MRASHLFASIALSIFATACPLPPVLPPQPTNFQLAQDINGTNVGAVATSVFGIFKTDNDGDGVIDQTVLEIFSSSQTDICARIANGEFDGIDFPEGTHVDIFIVVNADIEASTIDANSAFILSTGFLSKQAGIVQVAAFTDFVAPDATITLDTLDANNATGSLASTLAEDSTDSANVIDINVALNGSFESTHCQALSDILATN
jgi:hypothetical protein